MNRSAISLLLATAALTVCTTSFSDRAVTRSAVSATPAAPVHKKLKMETLLHPDQVLYYWYSWPDDTFNDRKSLNDEIFEMWLYYAALVDTDPSGGILIERGYNNGVYPHNLLPYYFLYVHYVYE